MKNIIVFLLIGILATNCSKDDNDYSQIVGNWKLVESKFYGLEGGTSSEGSIDYSNENIFYNFKTNGILIVTGQENVGYTNGEYEYSFENDHFGDGNDPPILFVEINNSKWTYNFSKGKMTLGKSYVDGPDLIFKKN